MEEIVLKASRRDVIGKQVSVLRREGKLPGVIYGRKMQPIPIVMDLKETSRLLTGHGSALVSIDIEGQTHYALVREKQRNPILGSLRHIDFQTVSLTEKVRTNVPVVLRGDAPAIKTYGGVLVANLETLEVEALPRDLIEFIDADVTGLENIGDVVHVSDLVVRKGVEILANPEDIVAVITAPLSEAALDAIEGGLAEPELIERARKEEVDD